jgi:glycolate oxidase iron-sulfur subunit
VRGDGAAALTAACAKCGNCRAVCTLYPERKAESAVARGKIAVLESGGKRGASARKIREAVADCLLCGRCARACPNGTPVEEILLGGRAGLAEELGIPAWERILFGKVLASGAATASARTAAAAAQKLLPGRIPTASGLHYRLPEAFGLSGRTLPALPRRSFTGSPAAGEAGRGDVTLFVGCVFDHVFPEVGRAAYDTLRLSGRKIAVFREAACCGLPALAAGDRRSALRRVEENVRRLVDSGTERIVFPCGSCLLMFRRNMFFLLPEGHPLRETAARVSAMCEDYAGFLLSSGAASRLPAPPADGGEGRVGYHDPCHLSGTLGKKGEARELLRRTVGGSFGEMEGADLCCGYGGSFNVRDYPTSGRIGANKVSAAERGGTSVIATACSGCVLHLRDAAARDAPGLRVLHLAELVFQAISDR